jgi:hypothetical protein
MGRYLLTSLGLMALFFLSADPSVQSIDFGPISFSNFSTVRKFIPVLSAYLFSALSSTYTSYHLFSRLYFAIMRTLYPALAGNTLNIPLMPPSRLALTEFLLERYATRRARMGAYFHIAAVLIIFLFPLAFLIVAFRELLGQPGGPDLLTWISMALSAVFVVDGFFLLLVPEVEPGSI